MDFWPASNRTMVLDESTGKKAIRIKRESKTSSNDTCITGPVLSPGNGISAAAILRVYEPTTQGTRKHLSWDFVTQEGPPLHIYPPTTLLPGRKISVKSAAKLSSHRRAEEGARFLRQRYPDIDIPFEIIKEYIDDDYAHKTMHDTVPSTGNRLALVHSHHASRDRQIAFVFPTGSLGNQLNVSSSGWSRSRGSILNISSSPVATFDTPVSQIVSSTYNHHGDIITPDLSTFAVRTMSFCALFSVNFSPIRSTYSQPSINQLIISKHTDTGTILDICASPFTFSRVLAANETGRLTLMQLDNGNANQVELNTPARDDSFWRVCWANEENSVLRASSSHVELLDIRDGPGTTGISLNTTERLVALEARSGNLSTDPHTVTVTTDKRVIWLDDRYFTKPLLSWQHNRANDFTLATATCSLGQMPITCLFSQNNGLVTLYDISVSSGLPHSNRMPQVLETDSGTRKSIGHAFYRHPASENRDVHLVVLSEDGGLLSTCLSSNTNTEPPKTNDGSVARNTRQEVINSKWDMEAYNSNKQQHSADTFEPFSIRESFEVDFQEVYRELRLRVISKFTKEENIDHVRDILEIMPRIWQEVDRPLETIMTIQDIASYASAEPGHIARADFLNATPINSQRAKSAFQNGHLITSREVKRGSAWSFDLSHSIDLVRASEPRATETEAEFVTYEHKQHNISALLDIDIALGNDVFSSVPFKGLQKVAPSAFLEDEILRKATQSLSIEKPMDTDPPPLSLSFLIPRPGYPEGLESMPSSQPTADPLEGLQEASIGIRHLLSDWELGSDPTQFRYVNPYPDVVTKGSTTPHNNAARGLGVRRLSPQIQPQSLNAPPKIGLVRSAASIPKKRELSIGPARIARTSSPIQGGTQIQSHRVDLTTRSQEPDFLGVNTQILSGKHGGRSKKTKKRMGGF